EVLRFAAEEPSPRRALPHPSTSRPRSAPTSPPDTARRCGASSATASMSARFTSPSSTRAGRSGTWSRSPIGPTCGLPPRGRARAARAERAEVGSPAAGEGTVRCEGRRWDRNAVGKLLAELPGVEVILSDAAGGEDHEPKGSEARLTLSAADVADLTAQIEI